MPFVPTGLPTLPTCESDIARWAVELETYIVAKFTTAHNEIDNVVVSPFDICAELGSLSAPSCLVPVEGIDNTGFTYAEEGEAVVAGSGVLPWPGVVVTGVIEDYRQGSKQFSGIDSGSWKPFTIQLSPAVAHANYHVFYVPIANNDGTLRACDVSIDTRTPSSFQALVTRSSSTPEEVSIRWLLLLLPEL